MSNLLSAPRRVRPCGAVLAVTLLAAASTWAPRASAARPNDFDLTRFVEPSADGRSVSIDARGLKQLTGDLAMTLHPKFAGAASTYGALGVDFGYELAWSDINEKSGYWQTAANDPTGVLTSSHFYLRKGFPYSIEAGGFLSYLHESSLWGVGAEVKWAFLEGHTNPAIPEFGVRAHINMITGNPVLSMLTYGGEAILSWQFGVAGLFQLNPYLGYEGTGVYTKEEALYVYAPGAISPTSFTLPRQDYATNRFVAGLRIYAGVVDVGAELLLGDLLAGAIKLGIQL